MGIPTRDKALNGKESTFEQVMEINNSMKRQDGRTINHSEHI